MPNIARNKTDLADLLHLHVRARHLPPAVREFKPFTASDPPRQHRLDLAWPDLKLFVECQGGELMQGRHNRAAGMAADCEKLALLTLAGWRGFLFTGQQVRNGFAIGIIERWFREQPC